MKPFATALVFCLWLTQLCTAAGTAEWIDDNRLVVGNETGAAILSGSDFDTVEIIPTASPYPPGVRSGFHVSSNGAYLATGFQAVEIWNIEDGVQAFRIPFSNAVQTGVIGFVGAEDRLALIQKLKGNRFKFFVIEWRTGRVVFERLFPDSRRFVNRAVSPDGRFVTFTDSEKVLFVWDNRTETLLNPPLREGHTFIGGIRFSPDSRIAALGNGAFVDFYETEGWTPLPVRAEFSRTDGGRGGLHPLRFIDNRRILIHDDHWVYFIFDLEQNRFTAEYRHREVPSASWWGRWRTTEVKDRKTFFHAVSADGSTLVTYPEGLYNLQRFELSEGLEPTRICEPECYGDRPIILDLKLSPSGRRLFVSSEFGIDLWDLTAGRKIPYTQNPPETIPPSFKVTRVEPQWPSQDRCIQAADCLKQGKQFGKSGEYDRAAAAFTLGCKAGDRENCLQLAGIYLKTRRRQDAYHLFERLCREAESEECLHGMKQASEHLRMWKPDRMFTVDTDLWCREAALRRLETELETVRFFRDGKFIGLKVVDASADLSRSLRIKKGHIIANSIDCIDRFCNQEVFIRTLRTRCGESQHISIRTFDPEAMSETRYYFQK